MVTFNRNEGQFEMRTRGSLCCGISITTCMLFEICHGRCFLFFLHEFSLGFLQRNIENTDIFLRLRMYGTERSIS